MGDKPEREKAIWRDGFFNKQFNVAIEVCELDKIGLVTNG